MSGRARLAAWAVGVFLALCITNVDAAGYLVSNCSEECSVIVETTGDIDATCEPVEGLEVFECECYRPYVFRQSVLCLTAVEILGRVRWHVLLDSGRCLVSGHSFMTNWEEVNGTIVAIGDHPKCRHAFSYGSGGLLALQYLPNILCIICIVYVQFPHFDHCWARRRKRLQICLSRFCRPFTADTHPHERRYAGLIISNKAEAIMSRSNSELKSPRRCVCVYNQLIGAAILIIAAQLLRVVYLSVDPQG